MEFLSLSRRLSSSKNVPSGEEWGETAVFAGYIFFQIWHNGQSYRIEKLQKKDEVTVLVCLLVVHLSRQIFIYHNENICEPDLRLGLGKFQDHYRFSQKSYQNRC